MIPYANMGYHPTAEKLVKVLLDRVQVDDPLFFRIIVASFFSLAAAQMRCSIAMPGRGDIPVNMYALNLAPSGYGKTISCNFMEEEVLAPFRKRFLRETFPIMAQDNLPKLAVERAQVKQCDPDEELKRVISEFKSGGNMLFSFDSGTSPAVKQLRHKLLMANAGSLNLIMDEVGANLTANSDVFATFIELFDKGLIKQKLIKNTADNVRNEEIIGKTPTNLLMFGVPSALLDGAKTEEELMKMLDMGYARRCFFGYIRKAVKRKGRTAEGMYEHQIDQATEQIVEQIAEKFESLADIINANKRLLISKDVCIALNEYQLDCEARADALPDHQEMRKHEMANRFFKVLKLAGAYAFIDDVQEITEDHLNHAIRLAEDSGAAFETLLSRDKPWVKLAKYVASVGQDITQADLAEDLPFYKGGVSQKQEMMNLAIAYGYKHNIIIKKSFADGIEFLRGETLKATDLSKMIVSYSTDMTTGYLNEAVAFGDFYKITQAQGYHWINHHLEGGYRNEENAIPGFNLVTIDVDGTCNLSTAKLLLAKYKALYYTTKRHTDEANRFRIVLPVNYELKLDAKDYKEFFGNLLEWLPFEADESCRYRCKKWLSHAHYYEYTDGELLDVLPFIPKTSKNEDRKQLLHSQQSMDNLERWVINNIGDGNRNNMLHRYGMLLVDAGFDFEGVRSRVMALNEKIADKLEEAEIMSSIMVTVTKEIAKR